MAEVYRRGRVWWVRFRAEGQHVRRSAQTEKKSEAQAVLLRLMNEHAAGARDKRPRHTYAEAVERFFAGASIKPRTKATYQPNKACRPTLESLRLADINRRVLADHISARKQAGGMRLTADSGSRHTRFSRNHPPIEISSVLLDALRDVYDYGAARLPYRLLNRWFEAARITKRVWLGLLEKWDEVVEEGGDAGLRFGVIDRHQSAGELTLVCLDPVGAKEPHFKPFEVV